MRPRTGEEQAIRRLFQESPGGALNTVPFHVPKTRTSIYTWLLVVTFEFTRFTTFDAVTLSPVVIEEEPLLSEMSLLPVSAVIERLFPTVAVLSFATAVLGVLTGAGSRKSLKNAAPGKMRSPVIWLKLFMTSRR